MAKTFPLEAATIALKWGIPLFSATTNAASDEKGRIVAAANAERKRANASKELLRELFECFHIQKQ